MDVDNSKVCALTMLRSQKPGGPIRSLHTLCRAPQVKQGDCNVDNLDDRMKLSYRSGHEKRRKFHESEL